MDLKSKLKTKLGKLLDKWLRKLLNGRAAALAALVILSGCTAYDAMDDREWHDFVEARVAYLTNRLDEASGNIGADDAAAQVQPVQASPSSPSSPDAVEFSALRWDYGGFGGKGAVAVNGCTISGLKVSSSGMGYKWERGGCEQLGASSRTAADCIAAIFVRGSDGLWRGGKFDWISTSRTTRDFKNISEGYNGWPPDSIKTATAYAFVIVSRDGRKRSNVISQGK